LDVVKLGESAPCLIPSESHVESQASIL
jgi:hypothetical protein